MGFSSQTVVHTMATKQMILATAKSIMNKYNYCIQYKNIKTCILDLQRSFNILFILAETSNIALLLSFFRGRGCPVNRVLMSGPEGPDSRLARQKLLCTLMAPCACKIRRGCNVLQVPNQFILLGVPKLVSHPLHRGSKLRWHVSGLFFGMNPRPSAITH